MIIDMLSNVAQTFESLLYWMPATFIHFINMVFLCFCASFFFNIVTKFVKFVRG